jgi:hypothetical protein
MLYQALNNRLVQVLIQLVFVERRMKAGSLTHLNRTSIIPDSECMSY